MWFIFQEHVEKIMVITKSYHLCGHFCNFISLFVLKITFAEKISEEKPKWQTLFESAEHDISVQHPARTRYLSTPLNSPSFISIYCWRLHFVLPNFTLRKHELLFLSINMVIERRWPVLCHATALSVHGYICEVMEKAEGDGYVPQTQKYLALGSED